MKVEWKNPFQELPVVPDKEGSVCTMVTPGLMSAQYPMKAWYNGHDGYFWLANGDRALVKAWDYYPKHLLP